MGMWSAWKHLNRFAGRRATELSLPTAESDDRLTRALHSLREEPAGIPSWNEIERVIRTGKKEHSMAISRAAVFAFSRKAALIAATSFMVVLAFFTIPFSQTGLLGSNIVFTFDPPLENPQSSCDQFAEVWERMGMGHEDGEAMFGMAIKVGDDGLESVEVTLLAESGMTADELIAKLKNLYPIFEHAAIAVNPITEHSTSTMFGRLLGNAGVRIECKGKTAEEIEAELKALLAAQGVNNPNILVIKPEDDGKTRIKICVPFGGCGK